jgi:hypothetical protein
VNIDNSSPAQALRTPFIFRRPLAGRAGSKNASTDTKKARFTANSLGEPGNKCPGQSSHRPLLVLIMILQCTIAVLAIAFREIASMHFDRSALRRTHLVGGYS